MIASPLSFNRVIVWVCKNFNCPNTSKYQDGQKCSGCGGEVGGLPAAYLGRWLILKRTNTNSVN